MKDIGNANFWGRSFSAFGWTLDVRVRTARTRPINREWVKVSLFNYNYSEEAKERSSNLRLDTCPTCGELHYVERGGGTTPTPLQFAHGPAENVVYRGVDTTIRYDDEKDLSEGDVLDLEHADFGTVFARARVVEVRDVEAKDALPTVDDLGGTYEVESLNELLGTLNHYYDDPIEWDTDVRVVRFEVVEEFPEDPDL